MQLPRRRAVQFNPSKKLALLLQTLNPAIAFNPSAPKMNHPTGLSSISRSRCLSALSRMHHRTAPVMATAILERAPAPPPAPPPPPSGRGDGKGGGDNDGSERVFMRMLGPSEQAKVLDDWVSRARIYRMTGSFGNTQLAEKHGRALESMEALRAFDISDTCISVQHTLLALSDSTRKVLVLASAEASYKTGLLVKDMAICPAELNRNDSPIETAMCTALYKLSKEMGLPLALSQDIKERVSDFLEEEEDDDRFLDRDEAWAGDDAELWMEGDEDDDGFYILLDEDVNAVDDHDD